MTNEGSINYDSKNSRGIILLFVLFLLVSPGALIIFIGPENLAPVILIFSIPVSLLIIYWIVKRNRKGSPHPGSAK